MTLRAHLVLLDVEEHARHLEHGHEVAPPTCALHWRGETFGGPVRGEPKRMLHAFHSIVGQHHFVELRELLAEQLSRQQLVPHRLLVVLRKKSGDCQR